MEVELDLAGRRCEGAEPPSPIELAKGSVTQPDNDALRRLVAIGGREMRPYSVKVDLDPRYEHVRRSFENGRAAAPRQEIGVVLDPFDQIEHLLRAMLD